MSNQPYFALFRERVLPLAHSPRRIGCLLGGDKAFFYSAFIVEEVI
ncbi:MAG: hypothetical protein ACREAB_19760 [Blastocatellia bacterium]